MFWHVVWKPNFLHFVELVELSPPQRGSFFLNEILRSGSIIGILVFSNFMFDVVAFYKDVRDLSPKESYPLLNDGGV